MGREKVASTVFHVLFLCTGNSARSIMAEAAMNHPPIGGGTCRAYSAGSHPKGTVHPLALEVLLAHHVPVEGLRSKSWEEFARPDAPRLDLVITVCDQAAAEPCPYWPGQPITAHWGIPDPAAVTGPPDVRRGAFEDAFLVLRRRIELLGSVPPGGLDDVSLRAQLERIGRQ